MSSEQLETIISKALPEIGDLLTDLMPCIREAAAQVIEDTADAEGGGSPKVNIPIKLAINLKDSPPSWQVMASVSVKHAVESEKHRLDDPNQPGLPFSDLPEGASVTISTGDVSATIKGKGKKEGAQ